MEFIFSSLRTKILLGILLLGGCNLIIPPRLSDDEVIESLKARVDAKKGNEAVVPEWVALYRGYYNGEKIYKIPSGMVGGESTIYDSQGREIGYSKPGDDDAPRCYIRGKEVSCDGIEWEDEAVYNLEESTLDDAKVIEELKQEVDKKQGGEPLFSPELYRGTDENGKTVYLINGGGGFIGGSDQIYNSQGNRIADRYWSDMLLELEDGTSALSYCDFGDGKRLKCPDYKWEEEPTY